MTRLNVDCTGCTVSIPVAASLLYSKTFLDPLYFFFPCCPFFCLRIVPTCILSSTLPYPPSYFPTSRCSVLQNSQLPFPVEWLFILYFFCFLFWEVLFFFLVPPKARHKTQVTFNVAVYPPTSSHYFWTLEQFYVLGIPISTYGNAWCICNYAGKRT